MGLVLSLKQSASRIRRTTATSGERGEIVIFPGVRREWHDLDLGHRVRDSLGDDYSGLGDDGHLPRKTS